ncbi:conserved hypothetical protein [Ricinus communis]|uniref:Uncharacterized protein n=1 Tax=Ricinus communis TaxID=3988 RepID=B9SGC3_RICCO|nr:conserved hypothetical protein [Ricinus communis]
MKIEVTSAKGATGKHAEASALVGKWKTLAISKEFGQEPPDLGIEECKLSMTSFPFARFLFNKEVSGFHSPGLLAIPFSHRCSLLLHHHQHDATITPKRMFPVSNAKLDMTWESPKTRLEVNKRILLIDAQTGKMESMFAMSDKREAVQKESNNGSSMSNNETRTISKGLSCSGSEHVKFIGGWSGFKTD